MKLPSTRLRSLLLGLLVISAQACTRDVPNPAGPLQNPSNTSNLRKVGNIFSRKHTGIKRQRRLAAALGKINPTATASVTALTVQCFEIWDVYYNLDTGEVVGEKYIGQRCSAGGSSDGSSSGSSSGDGKSGSDGNGSWGTTETSDTEDNSPPADCNSWPFRKVGPSGYMACGVLDVRIDVLSQYEGADGKFHLEYVYYVFDTPLYFEMPPRYTPGQAADICADFKNRAERFVERKFGSNSIPPSGNVIERAFYSQLATLMQSVGGRLSRTANYPNTAVGEYGESLLPGGCS